MIYLLLSCLLLIGLNVLIWQAAAAQLASGNLSEIYFLSVGQGDSQLIELPSGAKILMDGGPDKEVSFELGKILAWSDRYIDLIILTHAEQDHFGGLSDVISRYRIGAFIWNGGEGHDDSWQELRSVLLERGIPIVQLGKGERIAQGESRINILAPNRQLSASPSENENSLVVKLESSGVDILFTGDIGTATEARLIAEEKERLDTDVLKVAHHGSRYSSGADFLMATTPAVAMIEVGKNNYGHPHPAVLQRLGAVGASVYRTDKDGTVHLVARDGLLGIGVERSY